MGAPRWRIAAPQHTTVRPGFLRHPSRLIAAAFLAGVAVGTLLLWLPFSTEHEGAADFGTALFTATSAVTVTGLVTEDTATYWSTPGEIVILLLFQLGGIGIMSLASLMLLGFSRRLRLKTRLVAQMETNVLTLGEVRTVLRNVMIITAVVEPVVALLLAGRMWTGYGMPAGEALWHGFFHSVSAFNSAGFALYPDSIIRYATDPFINVVLMITIILSSLGVPVLAELATDRLSWRRWTLHTRVVIVASAVLVVAPAFVVLALEWTNPGTLGPMSTPDKVIAGFFQSVTARSAGLNTVDTAALRSPTLLVVTALMFIGGAPASTAGGIKVTTWAVLSAAILTEMRGDSDVVMFRRRIPPAAQRQALAIAALAIALVIGAAVTLSAITDDPLGAVLFEVTSAFGTTGLSTGVSVALPTAGHVLLGLLMFAGRIGPLTVGVALADRSRDRRFRYPEERPLIG